MVKICGLTDAGAVTAAVESGADAVGFVFAPSPRQIAPQRAYDITRRLPPEIIRMLRSHRLEAPIALDYGSFARPILGAKGTEAAIGFASLPTFHGDPGSRSAAFVHERIQRSFENDRGHPGASLHTGNRNAVDGRFPDRGESRR